MAKIVSEMEFENEVIKSEVPVVVDFFATWCGPCKMISPILDQLSDEFANQAKIVKVDVDQAKEMAINYNVKSVPTLIVFKNGEVVDKIVGALPKSEIKSKITPWV
ncbi:MAG: thioredoxin [Defluviitaleaceae bacterium]|nr:thioredoxin [Defluviitaleaceae bacterium]